MAPDIVWCAWCGGHVQSPVLPNGVPHHPVCLVVRNATLRRGTGLNSGLPVSSDEAMPRVCDSVLVYMKAHRRPICASCVSRALRLPLERLMDAWSNIRLSGDAPIREGECSRCGARAADVMHPGPIA